jgi:hypothetical protein
VSRDAAAVDVAVVAHVDVLQATVGHVVHC